MTVIQATRREVKAAPPRKRFIAVAGVSGAGRSTIALNLAAALASSNQRVLLIDADTWQPSQVTALGITEHPVGLAALCRSVRNQTATAHELQRQSQTIEFGKVKLQLIPGISNSDRWAEVTPGAMQVILELALATFDAVVVDCPPRLGAELQRADSPLRRDALLEWLTENAETALFVANADPVGVARLVEANPQNSLIIVNRFRASAIGLAAKLQIKQTVETFIKTTVHAFLPLDQKACDQALQLGGPLQAVRRNSTLLASITKLARDQKLSG